MNADRRVMEYFPTLLDRDASDALADWIETKIHEQGWGLWAVELRQTQSFIGFVGLNRPAIVFPFSPCVEVGWRLAFPYWGKGYASEAAREALRIGFEVLDFDEIVSFTSIHNQRSRAVMERLKMRQMPETFLHPKLPPDHPLAEHCLYKQRRSEFTALRAVE
jgi:RimJ/RimL family protein N-acetyltransferase